MAPGHPRPPVGGILPGVGLVKVCVDAADLITRTGLAGLLRMVDDVVVLDHEDRGTADVLVVGVDTFHGDLPAKLRQYAEDHGSPVLLVTDELARENLLTAVECRVVAVLPRSSVTVDGLARAVRAAALGGAVMPPGLLGSLLGEVNRLLGEFTERYGANRLGLSEREISVLRLLADGLDTHEVAERLRYSERTIKSDLTAVIRRLDLRSRSHAVAYAMRAGLI